MKPRNIVFSAIICLLVFGPSILYCVQKSQVVKLPTWLTVADANVLAGVANDVDLSSSATFENFRDGVFQESLQKEIENYIPLKADILLRNASIQRQFIKASNSLFSWSWYPTYYGSTRMHSDKYGLIATPIVDKSSKISSNLKKTAKLYKDISEEYPDIKFILVNPDSAESSFLMNGLRSNPYTRKMFQNDFFERLGSKITIVKAWAKSIEEQHENYFITDHHRTIDGGYDLYTKISSELGLGDDIVDKGKPYYFSVDFLGSQGRAGLDDSLGFEVIKDYDFDLRDCKVYVDDVEQTFDAIDSREKYSSDNFKTSRFANQYAYYFHNDVGKIQIEAAEQKGSGDLLIFGDSFTNNMERLFINNFDNVFSYNCKKNRSVIRAKLNEHENVKAVVIIQSFNNIID